MITAAMERKPPQASVKTIPASTPKYALVVCHIVGERTGLQSILVGGK